MGHSNKKKKLTANQQIDKRLSSICKFGESRDRYKQYNNDSKYIFSHRTKQNYFKAMRHLFFYCKEKYGIKDVRDCEQYVNEYIQDCRNRNLSSYTQKSYLSAFRKYYDSSFSDVVTDSRARSKIKRSRYDTKRARNFSIENNRDLIDFCKSTGLRRSELETLTGGDTKVYFDEKGDAYISGVKGKGGKVRDVRILANNPNVIRKIKNTAADQPVWGTVHSAANIHGYRADYAQALYKSVARPAGQLKQEEKYICQRDMAGVVFDRKAMKIVSESLGHNRIGIVAQNYLYNFEN